MAVNAEKYKTIIRELGATATLVAVSKTKPVEDIRQLYSLGQRHFGENYVQEMAEKQTQLPTDIHWHFIGHQEINKQAAKLNRVINVLLQVHIAREETKFGLNEEELDAILNSKVLASLQNICIKGLMGMASFSNNQAIITKEFNYLHLLFERYNKNVLPNIVFTVLSMGMSSDYALAIKHGSNMIRIGSLLFGSRENVGR